MTAPAAEEPLRLHPDHRATPGRRRAGPAHRPELRLVATGTHTHTDPGTGTDTDTGTDQRARRAGRRDRTVRVVAVLLSERPELEGVSGVADVLAEALVWSA